MQYNTTRYMDENQDSETLKDMTKSGKQRPWSINVQTGFYIFELFLYSIKTRRNSFSTRFKNQKSKPNSSRACERKYIFALFQLLY